MQDHRQVKPPGQLQLRAVKPLLARRVEARHKIIEADLANRHQARVSMVLLQVPGQMLQVLLLGAPCVEGMNAQRIAVPMLVRQRPHGVPVAALYRRNHAMADALRRRLGADRAAVGIELGGVEVAVGIDPGGHAPMMPDAVCKGCVR